MLEVNLFDMNFSKGPLEGNIISSTFRRPPTKIKWLFSKMYYSEGITVFTDNYITHTGLVENVRSRIKVAWLFEPRAISQCPKIMESYKKYFDYVLTYDPELLATGDHKYLKYIVGQTRVTDDEMNNLPLKTKNISLISSGKRMAEGHLLRRTVADAYAAAYNIDLFGNDFCKPFNEKVDALGEYKFSISIMNSMQDNFFTEILVDCFRTMTVPIFWGCPNIGEYFDTRGMIQFKNEEELGDILDNLPPYEQFLPYLEENRKRSEKYLSTDDYVADILQTLL
jgi:hypothetical protein